MSNTQHIPLVLALDDAAATLESIGGKGASLACMAAAGFPVPPGFHITTAAYRRFVAKNELQDKILAAVSAINTDQPSHSSAGTDLSRPSTATSDTTDTIKRLSDVSNYIAKLFAQSAMPDDIAAAISHAYAELGGSAEQPQGIARTINDLPVAVRSSATAEDLPEMSFAGQQETYLNMHGEAMVLDAVKRCWASLWTARAISYRAEHHIAPQDVSLAVVVQELVPANAAGILFTANPLTGERDQMMINAAWGLGEAIVSGQVTPDTFVVDKTSASILEQQVSTKDAMTVRTPEGTHEEPVPLDQRTQPALSSTQVAELARLGAQIEEFYGQPMDIEWALQDGRIFVVQARPITALPDTASKTQETQVTEWQTPDPKGLYTRNSAIELLPDPLSPLFATLGLPAWNKAMNELMSSIGLSSKLADLITINGYAYYDISPMKKGMRSFKILADFIPAWRFVTKTARQRWEQQAHPAYAAVVKRWETMDLSAPSATQLLDGAREIVNLAAEYYLTIQSGILPSAYMSESLFTVFYDRLVKRRRDPSARTFVLGYKSAPIQAEQSLYDLAQWARTHEKLTEALLAMSAPQFTAAYQAPQLSGVDDPVWSEFCQRFAAHLGLFGHVIYDLDFAKAVPADNPTALLETLKFFLSGQATDPHKRQEETASMREHATRMMLARLKGDPRLPLFHKLLKWAQDMAPLREDALADVGLGWPVLRRMLHEIGQRLVKTHAIDTQDDIFSLTLDEVQAAALELDSGQPPATYQKIIAERQATWKRQSTVTPPVALPVKGGVRLFGIDWSSMMPAQTGQKAGDTIKGIGASAGRISGLARVIHGPEEFDQMRPGDILVARITTPAWTPLFALAAGVVTDVGGPLSHSSIVAREYHIPAVLGTGVATERLHSGQHITVDGDAGTITIQPSHDYLDCEQRGIRVY